MDKRQYTLKDAREYIQEYYNVDWVNFEIRGENGRRNIELNDFDGDRLVAVIYIVKGTTTKISVLEITNNSLVLSGFNHPKVSFKDFYTQKHSQEKGL